MFFFSPEEYVDIASTSSCRVLDDPFNASNDQSPASSELKRSHCLSKVILQSGISRTAIELEAIVEKRPSRLAESYFPREA